MSDNEEIRKLLVEIRENQRLSLQRQQEHLDIAREQIERSRGQIEQSLDMQRQAIAKFKSVSRIAFPAIIFCIALIVYLVVRYL